MSEAPDWPTPESQPEAIHWKIVISSIVGTLILFSSAVAIVWAVNHHDWQTRNPHPSTPPALKAPSINEIETVTFPLATLTYQQEKDHRVRLEGWGWVSRERQLIHIPIEEAMSDLLAAQPSAARPGEAPSGASQRGARP